MLLGNPVVHSCHFSSCLLPPLRCQPRCLLDARESRPRWPWVLHSASCTGCTSWCCTTVAAPAAPGPLRSYNYFSHQKLTAKSISRPNIISSNFSGSAVFPSWPPPCASVPALNLHCTHLSRPSLTLLPRLLLTLVRGYQGNRFLLGKKRNPAVCLWASNAIAQNIMTTSIVTPTAKDPSAMSPS